VDSQPDSSLIYADSASMLPVSFIFDGGQAYKICEIKSTAFNNLKLPDSAYAVTEQTWLLANQYSDTLSRAIAAEWLGIANINQDKFILAEKFLTEAANIYGAMGSIYRKAKTETNLGIVFSARGNYPASQQHLLIAYNLLDKIDSVSDLSTVCLNIGNNYADMGNTRKARQYYNQASNLSSPTSPMGIRAIINIGILFRENFPDSALYYYRMASSIIDRYGDPPDKIRLQYNIANIYLEQKKPRQALNIFRQVLTLCQENSTLSGVSRALYGISLVHEMMNNPDSAIFYGDLALQTARSTDELSLVKQLLGQIAGYYKLKGDFPKALEMYHQARSIEDSIKRVSNESVTSEMELLETVQRRESESNELRMKLSANQTRIRNYIILIFILVVFVFLLGLMLRRSMSLNRKRLHAYSVLMDKYIAEREEKKLRMEELPSGQPMQTVIPSASDHLLEALIMYYETEKPYLDPKLKLDTVVERLNTTQKALSQTLKAFNNSNFNTFTNYFRVEEAKKLMEDPRYHNYKIESIANEAGFGTRMTFYNTFESQTGIKPSYYRESISKK